MNQITTQYVTENGACYEQYVITDPAAKTSLTITPERGGMITGFTLDGDEYQQSGDLAHEVTELLGAGLLVAQNAQFVLQQRMLNDHRGHNTRNA